MADKKENQVNSNPVEFTLFAPYNKWAAVQGDFSNWQDIEMQKGDNGYFCVTVDLADGDYEYKFQVESESPWQVGKRVSVGDPFATAINVYNSDNSVLHVRNGKRFLDDYQWQHDDKPLPANNELVIYELLVGDFATNFQGVLERLDYLSALGVNALELMPVWDNPGEFSWGYNVRHFFALEDRYGSSTDFKRLIDECHSRGIRIVLDMVFNHSNGESPLTQIDYNYWYVEHNTDQLQFGPKFDYNHWDEFHKIFPAREFATKVALYWVEEFHLDGIRFDGTYLINNFDFLREVGNAVKAAMSMKPFYQVAEQIPVDTAIIGPDMPLEGLWNNDFLYPVVANLSEKDFSGAPPFDWEKTKTALQPARMNINGPTAAVQYLANHDQNHLMSSLGFAGIMDDKAFRKAKLGFAVLLTSDGVPLIWMGDEFGQPGARSIDPHPLDFDLLKNERNRDLYHYVSGLIYLHKTVGAFRTDQIEFVHLDEGNKLLAWKRWDDGGSQVVVVANFSENALFDYKVPDFPDGDWHEYTFNYDISSRNGELTDGFGPSECKIYVKR